MHVTRNIHTGMCLPRCKLVPMCSRQAEPQLCHLHGLTLGHCCFCRWVYRNPYSILDPNAVDTGMGSKNGTVDSVLSRVPKTYQPRLRYCHMGTMSHLPNGSIAAQWQVQLDILLGFAQMKFVLSSRSWRDLVYPDAWMPCQPSPSLSMHSQLQTADDSSSGQRVKGTPAEQLLFPLAGGTICCTDFGAALSCSDHAQHQDGQHVVQANTKWYEGAVDQSIYWAVSDDAGLTWGPARVLVPSPDGLPLWGPVQHSAVRTPHLSTPQRSLAAGQMDRSWDFTG